MNDPYIGVTGFTTSEQVSVALEAVPQNSTRKFMVGVLASWKSLRGEPIKPLRAKRFPELRKTGRIFLPDERLLNLVHYNTEDCGLGSMFADMIRIHDTAGPNLHGFQLNVAWPEIRQLDEYRGIYGPSPTLILQLGKRALEEVGGTLQGVWSMLQHYVGVIDGILFDMSGGLGKSVDPSRANLLLATIKSKGWDLGLGVAGGLYSDSLEPIQPLFEQFPELSIDAEGRLRNAQNDLDLSSVKHYLQTAFQMFGKRK